MAIKGYLDEQVREKQLKKRGLTDLKRSNDDMVLGQVRAYQREQENQLMLNERKMMREKAIRDNQMMETNGKKQMEMSSKKAYENQLVTDLKAKISSDKLAAVKK